MTPCDVTTNEIFSSPLQKDHLYSNLFPIAENIADLVNSTLSDSFFRIMSRAPADLYSGSLPGSEPGESTGSFPLGGVIPGGIPRPSDQGADTTCTKHALSKALTGGEFSLNM